MSVTYSKPSNSDSNTGTLDGVRLMLEGQAADLHSTYLAECPQEHEYLQMVDRSTMVKLIIIIMVTNNQAETGGLFRIIYQLMRAESLEPEWVQPTTPTSRGFLKLTVDQVTLSRYRHDPLGKVLPDTRRLHEPDVRRSTTTKDA